MQPTGDMVSTDAFELEARVGEGAQGEVWKGRHAATGAAVALKLLAGRSPWSAASLVRFEAEACRLAGLSHPALVSVLDWGRVPAAWLERLERPERFLGRPFLVSERVDGGFVADRYEAAGWDIIGPLLLELLEVLGYLHAHGVLHLNLKPNNLLVERDQLRLTDAIFIQELGPGPRVGAIGPSRYCAPEQLYGRWRDCGPWTDLYGVGGLACRLITGQDPVLGPDAGPEALTITPRVKVPEGLDAWIRALVAERPDERPRSAAAAAALLRDLDPGLPLVQTPPPRRFMTTPWPGGRRWSWPTPGREQEREAIASWWTERLGEPVQDKVSPSAFIVLGREGQGRSALLDAMGALAHQRTGVTVLKARCGEGHGFGGALSELMRQWFRCHGMSRDESFERVRDAIAPPEEAPRAGFMDLFPGPDAASQARDQQAAALLEIMHPGGAQPDRSKVQKVRFARPAERYAVATRFLTMVAEQGPVLIALDDLHVSREVAGWVRQVIAHGAFAHPVLVMMTVEADPRSRQPIEAPLQALLRAPRVESLELTPLDAATLLEALGGERGWLAEGAAATPLELALELRAALFQGRLRGLPEGGVRREGAEPLQVGLGGPDAASRRALGVALASLPEEERASGRLAMELAAALGEPVLDAELEQACAFRGILLGDAVRVLVEHRLARRWGSGWCFEHALLRRVLLQQAADGERLEAHHRSCASALRALYDRRSAGVQERLSRHLVAAGEHEQALDALLEATQARRWRGDLPEAHALLDQREAALDALEADPDDQRRVEGWLRRARLLMTEGRHDAAAALLDRAEVTARGQGWTGPLAEALRAQGLLAYKRRQAPQAEGRFIEALVYFEQADDVQGMARCRHRMGDLSRVRGDLDGSLVHYEEACRLYAEAGERHGLARARFGMGQARQQMQQLTRADELLEMALSSFRAVGNLYDIAYCFNALGESARAFGDLRRARSYYERALGALVALGSPDASLIRLNLALVMISAGRHDDAEEALAALVGGDFAPWVHAARLVIAATDDQRERWGEARRGLDAHAAPPRGDDELIRLLIRAGQEAADRGWSTEALWALEQARDQAERLGDAERVEQIRQAQAEQSPRDGS